MNEKEKIYLELALHSGYLNASLCEIEYAQATAIKQTRQFQSAFFANQIKENYENIKLKLIDKERKIAIDQIRKESFEKSAKTTNELENQTSEMISFFQNMTNEYKRKTKEIKDRIEYYHNPLPDYDKSILSQYNDFKNEEIMLNKRIQQLKKDLKKKQSLKIHSKKKQ